LVLVTWEVMGAKHDEVKKKGQQQIVEKIAIMFLY
jgi:hypothetical protein